MIRRYNTPLMKEFKERQERFVPKNRIIEQMDRMERFYYEVDPCREYPYPVLCRRIAGFEPEREIDRTFTGEEIQRDLLVYIEELAESVPISPDDVSEPTWTLEELSKRFNVSIKTISRWRSVGLIGRRFLVEGKKRIGFLDSTVARFTEVHRERVAYGEHFRQMDDREKRAIIHDAKELARRGFNRTKICKQLAELQGRSVEAIRYTLKNYDETHQECPLFPESRAPLREEVKRQINADFRNGASIGELAQKHRRTKGSIYRIIGESRFRFIMNLPLDYVDHPEFQTAKYDKTEGDILASLSETSRRKRQKSDPLEIPNEINGENETESLGKPQDDLDAIPPYLAGLYEIPLLTPEQEIHLFRKMNYLKYRANLLRSLLEEEKPKFHLMSQIEELYEQSVAIKKRLISANLRLVVSIARKYVGPFVGFFELVSDGNLALMRAVEKYDFSRGNKFSTYASCAIMRHYARSIPDAKKQRERFCPNESDVLKAVEDFRSVATTEENTFESRKKILTRLMSELSEKEKLVLSCRYGLDTDGEPRTLRQIGSDFQITKERVRQIEIRALAKLQKIAVEKRLELP